MLYIIGLGLNIDGISKYGLSIVKKCKRIYLENYTVELPYSKEELKEIIGGKIIFAGRKFVESFGIIDEAKKIDVALLVYGSPLTATTHISLLQEANKCGIKYKIIYNASVFDAVAETGLQIYKFGKIASMPEFEADSFMEVVKENQSINAHSLVLVDIGLEFERALEKLEKAAKKYEVKLNKVIVCSRLGTKHSKIYYDNINNFKDRNIKAPYCIIIPSKLHFMEKEVLDGF
jgi:diphthine synthase